MNVSGTTRVIVDGKMTRICARHFNLALRKNIDGVVVMTEEKKRLMPSGGLSWAAVAKLVRQGKKATCRVEGTRSKKVSKDSNDLVE